MSKRLLDFILTLFGLLMLSPVFLLITILVRAKISKQVFFTQIRP